MDAGQLNSVRVGLRDLDDIARSIQWRLDCQYAAEGVEQRPEDKQLISIIDRREADLRYDRKGSRRLLQADERAVGEARIITRRRVDTLVRPLVHAPQACPQRLPADSACRCRVSAK